MSRRRSKLILPPKPVAPARADGRPLYYDLDSDGYGVQCYLCARMGLQARYTRGEAYMSDPGNSPVQTPEGFSDGGVYTICKNHVPNNAVIYDPTTGLCHNKSGTENWREDTSMPGPNGT